MYIHGISLDSPFNKFLHLRDRIYPWEALGPSSLAIPVVHPGLDSFYSGISDRMNEEVQSGSSVAALAGYGVNMDHPCVRAFTKEEVDANRKFLVASAKALRALGFFQVYFTPISMTLHLTPSRSVKM